MAGPYTGPPRLFPQILSLLSMRITNDLIFSQSLSAFFGRLYIYYRFTEDQPDSRTTQTYYTSNSSFSTIIVYTKLYELFKPEDRHILDAEYYAKIFDPNRTELHVSPSTEPNDLPQHSPSPFPPNLPLRSPPGSPENPIVISSRSLSLKVLILKLPTNYHSSVSSPSSTITPEILTTPEINQRFLAHVEETDLAVYRRQNAAREATTSRVEL